MKKREELVARFKEIADGLGVGFKDLGDKIKFYIEFNADFYWHDVSFLVWWKEHPYGGLNWWEDHIFDGKHRISGPGYPAYAIHKQDPVSEDELVDIIRASARYLATYKQYEHKI